MDTGNQIKMGVKSEKEHGKDEIETLGIVTDHLKEIPDYYTRLSKMEKGAPKSTLDFKKQLMGNPILAALKKNSKKKDESKQHEAGEPAPVESSEPKDDAKAAFIKKLVALKKKK